MAEESNGPVELYRAGSLPEAHAIRIMLDAEGVEARVGNELLQGALGELPFGWATAPTIVVDRRDVPKAKYLLEEYLRSVTPRGENEVDDDARLKCLACGTDMGEGEVCRKCGWSYGSDLEASHPEANAEPSADVQTTTPSMPDPSAAGEVPQPSGRTAWAEVACVLAVGVFPNLIYALSNLHTPPSAYPYWLDALSRIGTSACTIFVVLYLIRRSGEWAGRFGVGPPRLIDLPAVVFLVAVAAVVYRAGWAVFDDGAAISGPPSLPVGPVELTLMVAQYGFSAYSEELVTRGYLVTRLSHLLGSHVGGVVCAAGLFASYHAYQGAAGTLNAMAFGVAFGVAFLALRRVWPLAIAHAMYNIYVEMTWI